MGYSIQCLKQGFWMKIEYASAAVWNPRRIADTATEHLQKMLSAVITGSSICVTAGRRIVVASGVGVISGKVCRVINIKRIAALRQITENPVRNMVVDALLFSGIGCKFLRFIFISPFCGSTRGNIVPSGFSYFESPFVNACFVHVLIITRPKLYSDSIS